ncbi:MAG: hypothetical protein WBX15_15445 [Thermoanaerobaculia bacterium]
MRRLITLLSAVLALTAISAGAQVDSELLAGMKARAIGPATMSGRIAAIEGVDSDSHIVYVGAATGGVWKSVDGGLTWNPIFDDQPVHAIGAIAVYQKSPDIVWVGTGESNVRNSVSVGNGMYRSIDGGKHWTHVGLDKTEHIGRIALDPDDPNVAWAAALGQEWGYNSERGVYKTTDGGKTWRKVLYVDQKTGAFDLAIDPSNPNHLVASMWEFRRWPWFFQSGGPGSGLYVSWDGGESWKRMTVEDGMPKGILGKIGVDFSRSNPNIVYALVEAEKSVLLRSDDGGKSWKTANAKWDIDPRPFYFGDIAVDPKDPNRLYNLWTMVSYSEDGGKNFEVLIPYRKIHPDHHAMWIDPNDPTHIWDGNDGGVAESRDHGKTWRYVSNLPLGQYYHISYDMDRPYHIYGGMQDNGSWKGPEAVWHSGGIRNWDWQEVGFGDGFGTLGLSSDSSIGYAMSQEGYILRWNLKTGERKDIRPAGPPGVDLRFNWNAGIAADPFDPNGFYFGSQFLHHTSDRGETWQIISPDLTTNNHDWQHQDRSGGLTPDASGAENYTTIISIAPSPVQKGVVWVGTDDGRLQITRDGGATWASVEANVKGVPKNTWIPHIQASNSDAGTAWVVFDNHRRSDWTPYVYQTTDFGRSWKSLVTPDIRGYALTLVQDPGDPNLLFLGTEFGLWFSNDGGKAWVPFKAGLPTASVMALAVHPRDEDLIVATHGRSAYIVDDIRPLREVSRTLLSEPLHIFSVPEAQQYRVAQPRGERFAGDGEFRGENKPYGAMITYSLADSTLPYPKEEIERERKEKERQAKLKEPVNENGIPQQILDLPKEPKASQAVAEETKATEPTKQEPGEAKKEEKPKVEVTVTDANGNVIRHFKAPAVQGINRATWDLHRDAFRQPPREENSEEDFRPRTGPEIIPGTYTVTLKYKDHTASQKVVVAADPRFDIAPDVRQAKYDAIMRAGALQETATDAIAALNRAETDVDSVLGVLNARKEALAPGVEESDDVKALRKAAAALTTRLGKVEHEVWIPPKTKGILAEKDAMSKISGAMWAMSSSWDRPTPAQLDYLARARQILEKALKDVNEVLTKDVPQFRDEVGKAGIALFQPQQPITMPQ